MNNPIIKKIIIAAIAAFAVWAYLQRLYNPTSNKVIQIQDEVLRLKEAMSAGLAILKDKEKFRSEESSIKEKLETLHQKLPSENLIPFIVKRLSSYSALCNIDIQSIEPSAPAEKKYKYKSSELSYFEVPISMEIKGSYDAIIGYFLSLNSLDQLTVIRRLTLRPASGGEELEAELELATFIVGNR
jgi:type IV pilus assembly protein PilO